MPFNLELDKHIKNLKPREYKLELFKPTMDPFGYVQGICSLEFDFKMSGTSRVEFEMAKKIISRHKEIVNPLWDMMLNGYLLSLNDGEMTFVIDNPALTAGEKTVRKITAYSLDKEISYKLVRGFKSIINDSSKPRKLHTDNNDGVLDIALAEHLDNSWKIGEIDPDVEMRYRLVPDTDNESLYDFFKSLQKSYSCLFRYDTSINPETRMPNRIINIYNSEIFVKCPSCDGEIYYEDAKVFCTTCGWSRKIYGRDSALRITDKNYIKKYVEEVGNVTTRLYPSGKNGLDIVYVNPTGQEYIEDYSYYRNTKYMSAELLEAWDAYDVVVAEQTANIRSWSNVRDEAYKKMVELTYGVSSEVLSTIETLRGHLSRAIEYFNAWAGQNTSETTTNLVRANEEMKYIDDWFAGNIARNELKKHGKDNLEVLLLVYEQRINAVVELNATLKESSSGDGSLVPKTQTEIRREDGICLDTYTRIKNEIQGAINDLSHDMLAQQTYIDNAESKLAEIRTLISKEANFTKEQILEMNYYIHEDHWSNTDIGTSSPIGSDEYVQCCNDLYEQAKRVLYTASKPKINIDIDVIDFLSCNQAECLYDASKLELGGIITVEHGDSTDAENAYANMLFRIIAFQHNVYDNSLVLEVSNEENFRTKSGELVDIIRGAEKSTRIVSENDYKWNNAEDNAVRTMIQNGLDLALSTVKFADNVPDCPAT